jgi:hypothetical protein
MFLLLAPKYTGTLYWIVAAALYALAKVLEHFDDAIYSIGHFVSGHTLKHLVAAAAIGVLALEVWARGYRAEGEAGPGAGGAGRGRRSSMLEKSLGGTNDGSAFRT